MINEVILYAEDCIVDLCKKDPRVVGEVGLPVKKYDTYVLIAKTIVLCVSARGDKPAGYTPLLQLTGDGEAMTFREEADFLEKEFVDTQSTRVANPFGIPNVLHCMKDVPNDLKVLLEPGKGKPEIDAEGYKIPDRPVVRAFLSGE